MTSEEVDDTPLEGSAYLRHFSYEYSNLDQILVTKCASCVPVNPKVPSKLRELYAIMNNYEDLFYNLRDPHLEPVRELYCAHVLNHSLNSLRDQGFHRAKVLIILPTRESARRTVHQFLRLMPKGSTVSHRRRFEQDFGPQSGQKYQDKRKGKKPPDYEEWFSCNTDDRFRIGIAVSKKSIKLYSAFAESDIIIASPLGLETLMAEKDDKSMDMQYVTTSIEILILDQAEHLYMQNWATVQEIIGQLNQRPIKPSLSSPARIRLAYLAGYGARYRQTLVFSAVENYLINGIISKCENFQGANMFFPLPQFQNSAYAGYLPESYHVPGLRRPVSESGDSLTALDNFKLQLITFGVSGSNLSSNPLAELTRQLDQGEESDEEADICVKRARMEDGSRSIVLKKGLGPCKLSDKGGRAVPITRLAAFKQRILPRLRKGLDERVLIYVPDYYDLEELRKLLREEALSYCYIHEYTEDNEAERNRHLFDQGRVRIMLLSERYYFYRRRKIRGARNFIFYGPPTFPWFVRELLACCELAPAAATNASGESLIVASANPSSINSSSVTILYFPPWEAAQVSMITASIDV